MQSDTIQRFLIHRLHIRGEIVKLQASYQAIIAQQPYPIKIAHLLGKTLATSALLTASIKFKGNLTVQLQSNGPVKLLVGHCDNQFHIRGIAKWQADHTNLGETFADGMLAITIAPDKGKPYQGIVKLEANTLAQAIEHYFEHSEQLPTIILLDANQTQVTGILLQKLPGHTADKLTDWTNFKFIINELATQVLLAAPNEMLLSHIFKHEDVIIYDPQPITFQCTCSEERSANAIRTLSQDDITELLQSYKQLTVTCEFCNHSYTFNADAVKDIRSNIL